MRLAASLAALIIASPALAGFNDTLRIGAVQGFSPPPNVVGGAPTGMVSLLPIYIGSTSAPSTTAINYTAPGPNGFSTVSTASTEPGQQWPMPIPGTLKRLAEQRIGATAGAYQFSVRKATPPGALGFGTSTCDETANGIMSGNWASCQDTTHTDHFAAADLFGVEICPSAASPLAGTNCPTGSVPAGGTGLIQISALFLSDNANEQPLLGAMIGNMSSATTGDFGGFQSSVAASLTENLVWYCFASPGTIDNLYMHSRVAAGASQSHSIQIRLAPGAASPANISGLTASVSGASQTDAGPIAVSQAVARGDCISAQYTASAAPASSNISYGLRFKPTTTGDGNYGGSGTTQTTTTAQTRYFAIMGTSAATGASTSNQNGVFLPPTGLSSIAFKRFTFWSDQSATGTRTHTPQYITNASGVLTANDMATANCNQGASSGTCDSGAVSTTPTAGSALTVKTVNGGTAPAAGTTFHYAFTLNLQ